jgi:hypothetical protein
MARDNSDYWRGPRSGYLQARYLDLMRLRESRK